MIRIALTMLVGDRAKFLGIVFGLAFASLLITQQAGIFRGIMILVYGGVTDTPHAQIWVGDPGISDFDTNDMLNDRELDNVRAIAGVRWAVPLLRRMVQARDPNNLIAPLMIMGIDDATKIGRPPAEAMVSGSFEDLLRPDTVIIDAYGAATKLRVNLPGGATRPLGIGDRMIMNGRSIEVVGICHATLSLMLYPTGYMLRSHLSAIDSGTDRSFNYIIAGLDGKSDARSVCERIDAATGLTARTRQEFCKHVYDFFLYETGIPANFAIAVLLGFIVGIAIAGQTFSQYVSDNRRVFASLKAMGIRNSGLTAILLIQAGFSALLGFGLGVGGATAFGWMLDGTDLSFRLEPELLLITFAAILVISLTAAALSLRSLLRLDPALVFRS